MIQPMTGKHYEYHEFLLCSFEQELRSDLLCPEKMRKRALNHYLQ